ncbi:MAG: diaminopimelate epimerase [Candidatus Stahlbacteria bacterium]|nr:diaminopimelate epimerase [Candidatus Stahlbacteria bacterium]
MKGNSIRGSRVFKGGGVSPLPLKFVKSHCGGNDFIILDAREYKLPDNLTPFVQQITHRHTGIGADGVIVIEPEVHLSDIADFRVRYFNPDGSEYAVCGDGSLCVVRYANKDKMHFATEVGIIEGYLSNGKSKVKLIEPKEINLSISLNIGDKQIEVDFVEFGVPHTVVHIDDVNLIEIDKMAIPIRSNAYFGSQGTNVNFMQIINKHKIGTRSYERGVEGAVFSCGSGICACAVVGWLKGELVSPVEVKTRGGDFHILINGLDEIWLEGEAKIIYTAELMLDKEEK